MPLRSGVGDRELESKPGEVVRETQIPFRWPVGSPTVVADPFQGFMLSGRYQLSTPIGVGASARVYLAMDTKLKRRVAIKLLHEVLSEDQSFLKRFRAESQAAAKLNHQNIMHVYDFGESAGPDGSPLSYLVMEFVGGGSLRAVLDTQSVLSPSQTLLVGLEAARGLSYAHSQDLVHRDIKPANLLFGEEGRLRIADFGLARALAGASWTEPQGVSLGTARYMSPEQANGQHLDGRSDVYSLALVLIEAATGEVPLLGASFQETAALRSSADLTVSRSLGRLTSVLEMAGRANPEHRPTAGELEVAFLAASEDMDKPRPIQLPGAIPAAALDSMINQPSQSPGSEESGSEQPISSPDDTILMDPHPTTVLPIAQDSSSGRIAGNEPHQPFSDQRPQFRPETERASTVTASTLTAAEDTTGSGDTGGVDTPAQRKWPWLVAVILMIAGLLGTAAYYWFVIRVPTEMVPDFVGLTVEQAQKSAKDRGFSVATEYSRKDNSEKDEVIAQSPKAGTELAAGKKLTLTISLGPTLVSLPPLDSTMTETVVLQALELADLRIGTRTTLADEAIPAGNLISANSAVDSAGQLPKRSPVDIVISTGPAPRVIPAGLIGQSLDAVRLALDGIQVGNNVTEAFSEEVVGTVTQMNVTDGQSVPRGTIVELTVSKGPEPLPIPNTVGMTVAAATAALDQKGYPVSGVIGSPASNVVSTLPGPGELHPKGTPVQLTTG